MYKSFLASSVVPGVVPCENRTVSHREESRILARRFAFWWLMISKRFVDSSVQSSEKDRNCKLSAKRRTD